MTPKSLVVSVLFFLSVSLGAAQVPLPLVRPSNPVFLHHAYDSLPVSSIINLPEAGHFSEKDSVWANAQLQWVKVDLINEYPEHQNVFLSLPKGWSRVTLYRYLTPSRLQVQVSGIGVPLRERSFKSVNTYFPVDIDAGDTLTLYFKLEKIKGYTNATSEFSIDVFQREQTIIRKFTLRLIESGFFSIILVMALYNLILFFYVKDKSYIYYVLSIAFFGMYYFFQSGWAFEYLIGDYPFFFFKGGIYPAAINMMFNILFARSFIQTKRFMPGWDVFLRYLSYIFFVPIVLLTVYNFTRNSDFGYWAQYTNLYFTLITIILLISTAYVASRKGSNQGRIYLIAYVLLAIFASIYIVYFLFYEYSLFAATPMLIGYAIQAVLFSLGLAESITLLRAEVNEAKIQKERAERERIIEREKMLETQTRLLEVKVNERTQQLENANRELSFTIESLNAINVLLNETNQQVEAQKEALAFSNKTITDSIRYAKRIQNATLPTLEQFTKIMPHSFVFFKPRDIVSGDFYWIDQVAGRKVIIVADCTGHGVPGAFMSLVGMDILSKIIVNEGVSSPQLILNELHKGIYSALKQGELESEDGMDIAVCVVDANKRTLEFSGAKLGLLYVKNGQANYLKGDKHAVGGSEMGPERAYNLTRLPLEKGTTYYMFSDGFQDQFGGEKGKKLMIKNFHSLLTRLSDSPILQQEKQLDTFLEKWKGDNDQVDDILVVGFQV